MNYLDSYNEAKEILISAGVKEAGLDARLLLEYVCKTDHSALFVHPERELTEDEEESFKEMLLRRKNREPLAYILGFWEFMGLEFKVNRDVLIPEQDSEFLVEEALRYCEDGFRILDLCTGSGCIALSILNYTNETVAVCTDISDKALEIARENAKELGLSDRCEFIRTDLFPDNSCGRADIIVSNPPYIARSVIESLESEVKDYEPRIALDGDEDGLLFYRRIAERAGEFLFSSGYLFLEIGYDQADAVTDILQREGCYHEIEVVKDFSGNTRVVKACYY
ncbi:MAG: peptide chain release factor N(5)-glutamine methyltransferase [Butyrivibrio sp.]|nr:peptide chain release factor N(5)-glutamine methyltransferase [Butyrivibrio sp.]